MSKSKRKPRCSLAPVIFVFTLAMLACSQGITVSSEAGSSNFHEVSIIHDGRQRSYLVHLPPDIDPGVPIPVVISYHGGGGNAQNQKDYSGLDATADVRGFIAVYPNGTGRFSDRLLTWNAGVCCGYARSEQIDDVGFTLAVIEDLKSIFPVDNTRVYATGLSNGAMMAYRLAEEAPEYIAAIAPVAGAREPSIELLPRSVPVMHFHSLDDPRALYYGGLGPPFPFTNIRNMHPAVEDVVGHWARLNRCSMTPPIAGESIVGVVGTLNEGHSATRFAYQGCDADVEVVLWKLTGAGHVWPGGVEGFLEDLLGPSTSIVDANERMWAFFSRYQLETIP